MYLDITWFGYGTGLVLAGWVAGMAVGSIFKGLRHAGFL